MTQETETLAAIDQLRRQRERMLSFAAQLSRSKRFWKSPELQGVADESALVAEVCEAAINGLYSRLLQIHPTASARK